MSKDGMNILVGGSAVPLTQASDAQLINAKKDTTLTQNVKDAVNAEIERREKVN